MLTRQDAAVMALEMCHAGTDPSHDWVYLADRGEFLPRSENFGRPGEVHSLGEWADIGIDLTS